MYKCIATLYIDSKEFKKMEDVAKKRYNYKEYPHSNLVYQTATGYIKIIERIRK
jgi:hypothetical protein